MFKNDFIENLQLSVTVKELQKLINIVYQIYGQEYSALFL